MTSQFSPKVSKVLAYSREEAARLASRSVGPEHLLLGLLRMDDGPVINVFNRLKLNIRSVKNELESKVREDELNTPIHATDLVLNERASNILKLAVLEARVQRTEHVDEQHLLLAILHDQADNGAKQVLEFNDMKYDDVLAMLYSPKRSGIVDGIGIPDEDEEDYEESGTQASNKQQGNGQQTATQTKQNKPKTPVLENFGTNLTQAAVEGKLDPVIGRDKEMQRVIEHTDW